MKRSLCLTLMAVLLCAYAQADIFLDAGAGPIIAATNNCFQKTGGTITGPTTISNSLNVTGVQTNRSNLVMTNANVALNGGWLSGDGGSEGVYVTAGGKVGFGTASPVTPLHIASGTAPVAALFSEAETIAVTSDSYSSMRLVSANATAGNGSGLVLLRARGTQASPVIVNSGDSLGYWTGQGYDGSARRSAAQIRFEVDGTPGTNDMPGRIVFSTTADGSLDPIERMWLNNQGRLGINTNAPAATLHANGSALIETNVACRQWLSMPVINLDDGTLITTNAFLRFGWSATFGAGTNMALITIRSTNSLLSTVPTAANTNIVYMQ
jgi:hypothetical protein